MTPAPFHALPPRSPRMSPQPPTVPLLRARSRILLAGLLAPLAWGCRSEGRIAESERPIEIVVPTVAATLDPRYSTDAVAMRATRLVHAGLIRLDPDSLSPIPYAAQHWRFVDPLTLEVSLRKDVHFHSGQPLTSRDVCATIRALQDPSTLSPHRTVVSRIGDCEELSPKELRIRLSGPHATLLTDLEAPILRADEAAAPPRPRGDLDGLGPYRISRTAHGVIELEPVEGSPLPKPRHAVVIRTVRDENARALRLLAGRADIAPNALSPTLIPALEGTAGLRLRSRAGANVTYLLAQNERGPTSQLELRRAIASGIDRALIAKTLFAGQATVASTIFPNGSMAHPDDLEPLPHDPEAARASFARLRPRPLTWLTSTDRLRITMARTVAQQLEDLGLRIEVVPLDSGVLFQRLSAGDFDLASLQMPELTEPNLLRWFFHSESIPSPDRPAQGANRARYRNTQVDAWLDEAASLQSREARAALYAKVAHRFAADVPVIPLFHEAQIAVVSQRARDFEPSAEGRWLSVATLP